MDVLREGFGAPGLVAPEQMDGFLHGDSFYRILAITSSAKRVIDSCFSASEIIGPP